MQEADGQGVAPMVRFSDQIASEDDILYCFRLLLGRNPNPEEWKGHSAQAGEPLAGIVAGYLNSLEFSVRGLLTASDEPNITLTTLEGFQIYADSADAAVGQGVVFGSYEPEVTSVFRQLIEPGMTVIDIGANIGYFTMLSAALVGSSGHVFAIEPNPSNIRMLEASRRANGFAHVTVCQMAAGRQLGLLVLHSTHSNGTTSAPKECDGLIASNMVPCVAVDSLVAASHKVDFIKADVEGAEYNALLGCQRIIEHDRPIIVSELSPNLMPGISGITGPEFLRWLISQRYDLSIIRPSGERLHVASDWSRVMTEYAARGVDHLDIVAAPA